MKIYDTNHLLRAFPKIPGGNSSVMSHFLMVIDFLYH